MASPDEPFKDVFIESLSHTISNKICMFWGLELKAPLTELDYYTDTLLGQQYEEVKSFASSRERSTLDENCVEEQLWYPLLKNAHKKFASGLNRPRGTNLPELRKQSHKV